MRLHGTVEGNLVAAVRSARRLRGTPVHPDTVRHWTDLLDHARRALAETPASEKESLERLIAELETELASRRD